MPWIDEVMFADPSVNLLLGNGFTSTAWLVQSGTEFWAGYPPLYQVVLYLWMKVFGFSVGSVRSVNYVLVVVAVFVVWVAVLRLSLVTTARHRATLVALLLLGYGIAFCYRSARGADCVGIFLISALLLSFTLSSPWLRRLAIGLLSALMATAGLQLAVYAGALGVLLVLYMGKRILPDVACGGVGLAVGGGLLYLIYSLNGVLPDFVLAISGSRHLAGRRHGLAGLGGSYKDPSSVLLLGLALFLAASLGFRRALQARTALGFGVVAAFAVPAALFAVGHYPVYYSYMVFVPLSICVCAELSRSAFARAPRERLVARGMLIGTGLVGLPAIVALSVVTSAQRERTRIEQVVSRHVRRDDRVLADFPAYYTVKPRAAAVFLPTYVAVMSREEWERLTMLIVSSDALAKLTRTFGGQWHAVDDGSLSSKSIGAPSIWGLRYDFRIYRRQ